MKKIFIYFCLFFLFFLYTPRRGTKRTKLFFLRLLKDFKFCKHHFFGVIGELALPLWGIRDFPIILQGYASHSHKATLHIRARLRIMILQGYIELACKAKQRTLERLDSVV